MLSGQQRACQLNYQVKRNSAEFCQRLPKLPIAFGSRAVIVGPRAVHLMNTQTQIQVLVPISNDWEPCSHRMSFDTYQVEGKKAGTFHLFGYLKVGVYL